MSQAGHKKFSTAVGTIAIGGVLSCLFVVLAISTATTEHSDTPGPGFYIFGFLATVVFILSGLIGMLISLTGIIQQARALTQSEDLREKTVDAILKSVGLIITIIVVFLIAINVVMFFR